MIQLILIFVLLVMVLALLLILLVHGKEEKLSKEKDYIEVLVEKRTEMLKRNGACITTEQYYFFVFLSILLFGGMAYLVTKDFFMSLLLGSAGSFLPFALIQLRTATRNRKFNEEYAKALEQLAGSLKAGLSISQAVKDVVGCPFIDENIRKGFAQISADLEVGRTVQEAFAGFACAYPNAYAKDVALSIDIQNEVGGHEAEVIQEIAEGIHERFMLEREIRAIFNETVLTIRVMQCIAPLGMAGMLLFLPSYREVYLSGGFATFLFVFLLILEGIGTALDNAMVLLARKGEGT